MASSKLETCDFSLIPLAHLPLVNPNVLPVPELGRLEQSWGGGKRAGSVIRTLARVLALPLMSSASLG